MILSTSHLANNLVVVRKAGEKIIDRHIWHVIHGSSQRCLLFPRLLDAQAMSKCYCHDDPSGTNLTFRIFTTGPNFAEILERRGYHLYDFIH